MKKFIIFLIVVLLPMMANADSNGQCGDMVTYNYVDSTRTLTISGEGDMSYVEAPWEAYKNDIETVIINEGVTSIKDYGFYGCGFTTISIPNSVTSIGEGAFVSCNRLDSITIPNSVISIGEGLFLECVGLSSVSLPDSITSIGSYTFYRCKNLTSIIIPDSVTSIGTYAFGGCSSLQDVYCHIKTVPATDSLAFDESNITNATLYIPEVALTDYQTTSPWSEFGKFETLPEDNPDPTGIITPQTLESEYPVGIYTIDGRRISETKRGLNIIRMGNGRSKKVFIKR